jgi:transposase
MHVEPHLTAEELDARTRQQARSRLWRRFRAVALALGGGTAGAIATALGCTPRAVQKWLARYNDGGPEALADRPGRGRKPKLAPAEHDRLRERIEAGPTPEDGTCAFHGPDVRRIVRDEFGVPLSAQATYDLLHRLGLSSLMPRPAHRKSDPEAQARFKRGSAAGSGASPEGTRPSGSRPGSATRPGSASKGR